ncbi:MAG: signal recognition particle protein [Alphaproteobacteria bacterium]|nr:signal recognition particle protein [Alphaproteobacteria bacterium]
MFSALSQKLTSILDKLKNRGSLTEDDVKGAMREVRIALLEADVALPVVRDFIARTTEKAIGQDVLKSITPGQMVVKIVHDTLVDVLGEAQELKLTHIPTVILMAGLQGSGKTTFSGKLAMYLQKRFSNKKILMESLDVYRPAARAQLKILAGQVGVTYAGYDSDKPVQIAEQALSKAKKEGYDVLILDTAGRLQIDDALMLELETVVKKTSPHEVLFVADSLIGQEAYAVAETFKQRIPLTGVVLTRVDGDGRGGAALSIRTVTGCPIRFLSVGEKLHELELFDPNRIADRILGMGDIVGLVERVTETLDQEESEALAKRMQKGLFDLNDFEKQLSNMLKMGGFGGIMNMLPGMSKLKDKIDETKIDEKVIHRQIAVIRSMTQKERKNPKLLNASRKRRIAGGSGVEVQDVNRLLKQHQDMETIMKRMKKLGMSGLMKSGLKGLFNMK